LDRSTRTPNLCLHEGSHFASISFPRECGRERRVKVSALSAFDKWDPTSLTPTTLVPKTQKPPIVQRGCAVFDSAPLLVVFQRWELPVDSTNYLRNPVGEGTSGKATQRSRFDLE
jgi:hypothetical protein